MADNSTIELQLLRWGEGPTGRTVTFLLPDDTPHHQFKGLRTGPSNGQRLGAAFVLIHDDESETAHEPEVPSQPSDKPASGGNGASHRLAQQAGIICGEGAFKTFLIERYHFPVISDVAEAVRNLCEVKSRREFDTDPVAGARWNDLHRAYIAWRDNP